MRIGRCMGLIRFKGGDILTLGNLTFVYDS